MSGYPAWLCTLADVRRHRKLADAETADDGMLTTFIQEASAEFESEVRRACVPFYATRLFDYSRQNIRGRGLRLDVDFLELKAATNGDGAAIAPVDAFLEPANVWPKYRIVTKTALWQAGTYTEQAIAIGGWWGYVPHYPSAWLQKATASAALNTSATTLAYALAAWIEVGQYWRIDDEVMQVTAYDGATVTFTRGQRGSVGAAHLISAPILVFQPLPDIRQAVTLKVAYKYLTKDRVGSRVQVYDGGTTTVEDLDRAWVDTINRHVRREL